MKALFKKPSGSAAKARRTSAWLLVLVIALVGTSLVRMMDGL